MHTGAQAQPDQRQLRTIPIASIRKDGETQHRTLIDSEVVAEYSALMLEGILFPPIRVWWDGNHYWLSDGFHRVAAAEAANLDEVHADVRLGSRSEERR